MPRRRQSLKAARQTKKRHARNKTIKGDIKTILKKLETLFSNKNIADAKNTLITAVSKLAKAAKKGVLHKNTARRKISRLSRRVARLP